ncbi:hypothetical protein [Pararhodonellum marinum]|uniref:hypothetical protein n=1 Tax=Pararhodonellum marinum TaxID=2755358 RepID=UPI001E30EADF|nr:hypothetical protein [Pararhodonellum marinum]
MKIRNSTHFKLFLFTSLIALIGWLMQSVLKPEWVHTKFWEIILFYGLLTLFSGLLIQYLIKISKENFASILLLGTIIRFLASIVFIGVLLYLGVENLILFVVNFFVVYLLYLLFDIYALITNLRPHSK